MKTNDYLLFSATAVYSLLFYEQNAGINFLVFGILLLLLLLIRNKDLLKDKRWILTAGCVLFSAVCIMIHSSAVAIIANVVSLVILSGLSFNSKTSTLFHFGFGMYSIASSFVYMILDGVKRNENKDPNTKKNYKWLGIIIVSIVSILFFLLYKDSSPIFAEYTKWIHFDITKLSWFFFTTGGFFLMYSFLYHKTIPFIESRENKLEIQLSERAIDEKKQTRLETEKLSLIVLFTLLNIMLLLINVGDFNTILLNGKLPQGIKHSDFVHNGVASLIFSIIFAICIIMYFLRNDLNFQKGNRFFKSLVLLWILQNILMLISTCWRNHIYISEYTLTHLRIGVYVWLVLAFIGLILTAVKIIYNKSNWFLVRSNFSAWILVLVLSSSVDWDLTIARYNLQNKKINEIDYHYLFSLSDTAIPELITFCKDKLATERVPITKNHSERGDYYNYPFDYLNLMHYKIESYLADYTPDIRSWDLRDERILKSIR
jgi:hypothetical protein